MPYKNKEDKKKYNSLYYQSKKRFDLNKYFIKHNTTYKYMNKIFNTWKLKMSKLNNDFLSRSCLPCHIYKYKLVLKDLLVKHFNKKLIKINNRTDLITRSFCIYDSDALLS